MSDTTPKAWLAALTALMLVVTVVVASTAIRIEWYNYAVGGFLPRPQPPSMEGNDVKWRTTSADMAEKMYRSRTAYESGMLLTDDELGELLLTPHQAQEVLQVRRHAELDAEFRALVGSWGLLQYPIVFIGMSISVIVIRLQHNYLRVGGGLCLVLNLLACGLMFYREYYPSLGW